jgi:cell division septation protein DedD
MRRLRWSAALFVLLCAPPAAAQQGALQLSAAVQFLTGDEIRLAGQNRLEPDLAISWFQPAFRFGIFDLNIHLTQRDDRPRLGQTAIGLRDVRAKGLAWSFYGGDTAITPSISDYSFSNLFAPRLNLSGGSAMGLSPATSISAGVGRSTALRNIFGSDSDVLDQGVAFVKARHRTSPAFEFSVRASGVRTRDLGEFSWSIADSRQAGGGVRYRPIGLIEFVGDAAYTSFRRRGVDTWEQDVSGLAGTLWTLPGGWVQINAQRLSSGEFPVLHNSLTDREGVFAAGEYDLTSRFRVFGGLDGFETNLDPDASAQAVVAPPRTRMIRSFGGIRTRLGGRSFVTARLEDGSRESQPIKTGRASQSDTALVGADWQATFGRWNTFARYARRANEDRTSTSGSFVQQDATFQLYFYPSRSSQVFGSAQYQQRESRSGGGLNFWQVAAGGQVQIPRRNLWLRAEGIATQTLDVDTDLLSERQALTVGFFGQVTNRTQLAFDLYVDRTPSTFLAGSPWTTRSTVRLVHSFATGSSRAAAAPTTTVGLRPARGAGSVVGVVFADWNGNAARDEGEEPLGGIALAVGSLATVSSGSDGQFRFAQVPVGLQQVGLDVGALPVDYDVPAVAKIDVDIQRDRTARVTFGLIPLGFVRGGVYRDANGNGQVDESDEPIDGAVLVMDEGARSELARGGSYRFDAVRAGRHTVRLLADSLPSGAEIQGSADASVDLVRGAMGASVNYLVKLEKRPEVRKVFPGASVPATPPRPATPVPPAPGRVTPSPPRPTPAAPAAPPPAHEAPPAAAVTTGPVAIQLAAVGRLDRAQALVEDLRALGFDAYILQPPAAGGDEFYRVRVGTYANRGIAEQAVDALKSSLEQPAVIVPAEPRAATPYRVQAAAVRDGGQARSLAGRLTQAGYSAYVVAPGPGAADMLHRVRVGTYPTREDAQRAADAIGRLLGSRVWVTKDQPAPRAPAARRAPETTATAAGPFVLQVAALGSAERAQALAGRIALMGFAPVVVSPQTADRDTLHRVRVGGFATRDEADRTADALEKTLGTRPWIVTAQAAAPARLPAAPTAAPAPAPQAPAGPFIVQVAALADAERAKALAQRLQEMGHAPSVAAPQPGGLDALYRVSVGPYATQAEAQTAATAIENALGVKTWIRAERREEDAMLDRDEAQATARLA